MEKEGSVDISQKLDIAMSATMTPKLLSPRKGASKHAIKASWTYFEHNSPRSKLSINDFIKTGILPTLVERPQVAQYIRRSQINFMIEGNYEEAEKYYNLAKRFTKVCKDSMKENSDSLIINKIDSELGALEDTLEQINDAFDQRIKAVIEQQEIEMDKLKAKHESKINEFISKWEKEESLMEFTKPSPKLAFLREREKAQILSKNFDIAADLKKQCDMIEKEETLKAQAQAEQTMQKERTQIEVNYKDDIKHLRAATGRQCTKIEKEKNEQVQPILIRMRKLNMDKEAGYFPDPKEEVSDIETEGERIPMALATPRTRLKLLKFRQKTTLRKLPLQGLKSQQIPNQFQKPKIVIPKLAMSR